MALTSRGFKLELLLVDEGAKDIRKPYLLVAADAAAAATAASTIMARFTGVSGMAIKGYNLTEQFLDDAVSVGSGIATEQALVTAKLVTAGKEWNHTIPAPLIDIFQGATGADRNRVDSADADLVTYMSTFESGGLASVSDGEFIRDSGTPSNFWGIRRTVGSTNP